MIRSPWLICLLAACAPPIDRGTFVDGDFGGSPVGRTSSGLASAGEVLVIEGEGLVSSLGDEWGIRFDEDVDDLARVTARLAEVGADDADLMILFTTFDDRGSGGPAYYVPFFDDVAGTGDDDVDQRDAFGVSSANGIVNFKDAHMLPSPSLFVHELAHRHLARLEATVQGSTTAATLLGRQGQHWHALLHTSGSVLGGHDFVESTPGRFVVRDRNVRLSLLDLYGLGLLDAAEVEPFFFIADGTNEAGFAIPSEAVLEVGAVVLGRRVDVTIEDVLARVGARVPSGADAPRRLRVRHALLTAPGESAESALVLAEAVDRFRIEGDAIWSDFTGGRGSLCSTVASCDDVPAPENEGCSCLVSGDRFNRRSSNGTFVGWSVFVLAVGVRAMKRRTPTGA